MLERHGWVLVTVTRRQSERYPLHAVGGACAVFDAGKNREKLWAKITSFIGQFSFYMTKKPCERAGFFSVENVMLFARVHIRYYRWICKVHLS